MNPFDALSKADSGRISKAKAKAQAPPFTRDELLKLYPLLPDHVRGLVRFAAHTGMRWNSEILRMTWGRVDLDRRVVRVDPRHAKRGNDREVPLGAVALGLLREIRPQNPAPDAPVWKNTRGSRLRDCRDIYEAAVRGACPKPGPGFRYPDFHSLRRTCANAVADVAPEKVVRGVLGHGKKDVTSLYLSAPLADQIAALDRAALLIDGEDRENVAPWKLAAVPAERKATA